MATREASSCTSSMLWVVRRMARSLPNDWRTRHRTRLAPASWPVDGSSSRRTFGFPNHNCEHCSLMCEERNVPSSAMATISFLLVPPLSFVTSTLSNSEILNALRMLSTLSLTFFNPLIAAKKSSVCRTVSSSIASSCVLLAYSKSLQI